jgi:hypothetical protein
MRTLKTKHSAMIDIKNIGILAKYKELPAALRRFWENLGGSVARFACHLSYGYAFRRIEQTGSLRFPQNPAFS